MKRKDAHINDVNTLSHQICATMFFLLYFSHIQKSMFTFCAVDSIKCFQGW